MTSFKKLPQTVFISGWGINFNFLEFFWIFFTSNGQIYIQTIEFKFKLTNQETTPHPHHPAVNL
jgi:hypothetical protein